MCERHTIKVAGHHYVGKQEINAMIRLTEDFKGSGG